MNSSLCLKQETSDPTSRLFFHYLDVGYMMDTKEMDENKLPMKQVNTSIKAKFRSGIADWEEMFGVMREIKTDYDLMKLI